MRSAVWQALRSWNSAKPTALLAVIAFAVGIGSTTAIFAVVTGVMLKPLPYPEGNRFVTLFGTRFTEPGQFSSNTFPDLLEYQRRTTSFDVFGWFRLDHFNLTSPGEPQYVGGAAVTPSLARNLGVNPVAGQWFADETGVVISNALWRRLGADADIVGKPITLSEHRLTVTGVMPSGFHLPIAGTVPVNFETDVWIVLDPLGKGQNASEGAYFAYARRRPGVTLAQAQADVNRAAAEIARLGPASHPSYTAQLVGLHETPLFRGLRPTLFLLFAAAALLLLISCANVATLLLARAVARTRETAIRVALGASQRQLAVRYFVEGCFVSLAGAAAGVVLSVALIRLVVALGSAYIPRTDEIAIDWTVLAFGLGIAFLASALSSLAPLWQAVRTAPNGVLTDGVRASAGAGVRRVSRALVVLEIAIAFTLIAVSSVLVVHLRTLTRVSPGFDPAHLLTFQITLADTVSAGPARASYQKSLTDALEAIPGVRGAAFANQIPVEGCCLGGTVYPEGPGSTLDIVRTTSFVFVSPDYFRTMGIPLRRGRFLNEADVNKDLLFAVIDQTAASRFWPDRDPVGAYGRLGRPDGDRFQVIGVTGDVRNAGLNQPTRAEIYLLSTIVPVNPMRFLVRSPVPPDLLIPEIRRAVQRVDPALAVHEPATMNAIVQQSLQLVRVGSYMMTFFGTAALLMATLGIYGVVSYAVRQRTIEIGTRMALGAQSRDVLALVVGGGLAMAAYGIATGGIAAIGAAWVLVRLFEIRDPGWLPFVSSAAIVAGVATAASFSPAWRATRLSPMVAIRNEPRSTWQSARRSIRHAMQEVAEAFSSAGDARHVSSGTLLTEFVAAARGASSAADALRKALATLCNRLGAESAMLLEPGSAQEYRCTAAAGSPARADCSVPAEGFLVNRLAAYAAPLPFTSADFDALLQWARENRPGRVAELQTLKDTGVRMAVPLRTKKEIVGILLLGSPAGRDHYTAPETHVLGNCADQFALMIENARLTGRMVDQEKLRSDLALAVEVQKRLLPERPPVADVAEIAAVSLPARSIGGDYYDFIEVRAGRIGIALADVSGKGIAAALIMSVVQASLRIISSDGDVSLPQLAAKMNRFLYRSTPSNKYATFFYAQLDSCNRRLRYVNAGHNPPYLIRAGVRSPAGAIDYSTSEIQELSIGGAVVGMFPEMTYDEAAIELEPGDVLVAFTDGVTEAQGPTELEFGEDRLQELLRQVAHLPAAAIAERISEELRNWIQDAAQYDDLTFIVLKVN
jgi:putative ABC transport system permease protein